jgi:DNA-damage-inducible protein D
MSQEITPFEAIRRTNETGNEYWSSRDFAKVLGYVNYRHFEAVIAKAKIACINSDQRVEDHFVGSDQMVEIGSGAQRALKTVMMSLYACYLVIQNADPAPAPASLSPLTNTPAAQYLGGFEVSDGPGVRTTRQVTVNVFPRICLRDTRNRRRGEIGHIPHIQYS